MSWVVDLNGDGRPDVVVAKGLHGAPRVSVFDGASGVRLRNFSAFAKSFTGGVRVAAGGNDGGAGPWTGSAK